ncbi:phytase [Planctobacterium marinum]|uniref:phytase n=1 Tax=Planctobacterium marinum TaxID=1631968 RepID=UPI001E5C6A54|nr:phytase [Planctobacterium marinum]MCC2606960.1 phytase [Planctobacterium marinum]
MLINNLNIKQILLCLSLLVLSLQSLAVEFLSGLPQQYWLVSTAQNGLQVLDTELRMVARLPGRYGQTDAITTADGKVIIAALNQNENSLDILHWTGTQLTLLQRQPETLLALEGVCLYQQNQSADVHAFLLLEHTEIEQRIIYHAGQQQVLNQPVRHLPVPDAVTACAVDSQRDRLYYVEEGVGVWHMSAHPESDKGREAVAMQQPFGHLNESVERLQLLADGSLVLPQIEGGSLQIYSPQGEWQTQSVGFLAEALALQIVADNSLQLLTGDNLNELVLNNIAMRQNEIPVVRGFPQIMPSAETDTMQKYGDAADDPAIWFNPKNPQESRILGTDKKRGLAVFDLAGNELQFLEVGRINNVDLRAGFEYQGITQTLAAASQRDNNSISLFFIDAGGHVTSAGEVMTSLDEVYGLCMYQGEGQHYVFINDKDGRYQQYQINPDLGGKLVREFKLDGQPEGCVANDASHELFVGIEDRGIWYSSARADTRQAPQNIVQVGGPLQDDVEGMALYLTEKAHYLVVSSQGNNSYALYHAQAPFDYVGSFQIAANVLAGIDGASETDGLDVSSANFGGAYQDGLLVVQDGRNVMPTQPQNFKLVAFSDIVAGLKLQ